MSVSNPEDGGFVRASMYRLSAGVVRIKGHTIFEMPGHARTALQGDEGSWILGDHVGALALIGTTEHIAVWLQKHGEELMRNSSNPEYEMTSIGIAVSQSMYGDKPLTAKDVRTLDPVGDTVVALVKGGMSFVPASGAAEFVMGLADVADIADTLRVKKDEKKRHTDLRQVVFQVAPEHPDWGLPTREMRVAGRTVRALRIKELIDGIVDGLERV